MFVCLHICERLYIVCDNAVMFASTLKCARFNLSLSTPWLLLLKRKGIVFLPNLIFSKKHWLACNKKAVHIDQSQIPKYPIDPIVD